MSTPVPNKPARPDSATPVLSTRVTLSLSQRVDQAAATDHRKRAAVAGICIERYFPIFEKHVGLAWSTREQLESLAILDHLIASESDRTTPAARRELAATWAAIHKSLRTLLRSKSEKR